jgi:hypothetical protein
MNEAKERAGKGSQPGRQEELERLIAEAVAQPGLAAMMKVYQSGWFRLGTQTILVPMPGGKVTVSTNSLPPTA